MAGAACCRTSSDLEGNASGASHGIARTPTKCHGAAKDFQHLAVTVRGMRILVAAASLCAILVSNSIPAVSALQTCSLDGLWLGRARNNDGVGMWLEFAADGSVVRAQGRIVDGGYAIKGDTLLLNGHVSVPVKGSNVPGKLSQKVSFKLAGAEMTRRAEQANVEAMMDAPAPPAGRGGGAGGDAPPPPVAPIAELTETKLTKVKDGSAGDPLSGVWTWTSKSGRTVLERFNGKNRFAILEPMGAQKGTYTLEGNKLSVTAGGTTTTVNVTCMGMSLTIETPNGPMRFLKFQ